MTKEKFQAYVDVQKSGATNMFDVSSVISLSGEELSKEDCLDIMEHYEKYEEEYKEE